MSNSIFVKPNNRIVKAILIIWFINIFIYGVLGFLPESYKWLTTPRAILTGLFLLSLIFFKKIKIYGNISKSIIFLIFYLYFLSFFSTNIMKSVEMTTKVSISLFMFVVGMQFFNDKENYKKLLDFYLIIFIFLIGTIGFSNVTGIGHVDYDESSTALLFGGVGVSIVGFFVLLILQTTIQFSNKLTYSKRVAYIVLIFVAVILIFLSMKRGGILSLLVSLFMYLLFFNRSYKLFKPILIGIVVLGVSFPLYQNRLIKNYEMRESRMYGVSENADDIDEEGRFNETEMVYTGIFTNGIKHALIGSELFNDFDFFHVPRMLHIDYNAVLNGSGLLGLFIYLRLYFLLFKKLFFFRKIFKFGLNHSIVIASISIVTSSLFVGISGSIRSIDYRSMLFLFLGATIAYLGSEYKNTLTIVSNPTLNIDKIN
jgi:hypothetical protein